MRKQPVYTDFGLFCGSRKVQLGSERQTQIEHACGASNAFMRSDNGTLVKRRECQQNNRPNISTPITVNASFKVPLSSGWTRSVSHQRKSVRLRSRPQRGRNENLQHVTGVQRVDEAQHSTATVTQNVQLIQDGIGIAAGQAVGPNIP